MKTTHITRAIQQANEEASKAFNQTDYQGAVECYNKALQLCSSLPEDMKINRVKFEAIVHSGLSAVFGRQGKHMESFAAANKALVFFEQIGELDDVETGKYLMAQANQGTALAALGCFTAALEALQKAKDVFKHKCLDPTKNVQWLKMVDSNIVVINGQIKKRQE
ncbi:MAG: tetratricopeptide repeat protein [Nitrososphaerota archaeon]|jgi:tetratricopeptide (TPR) repeat protein|nr:tetratricopeptide repeat protein [Nitrososphaerota archaeon]